MRKASKQERYYLSLLKQLWLEHKDIKLDFEKDPYTSHRHNNVDGENTDFYVTRMGELTEKLVFCLYNDKHSRDWTIETWFTDYGEQLWAIAKEIKGKANGTYANFKEDSGWIKIKQEDD